METTRVEQVLRFIHWNKKINDCLKITYFDKNGNEIFNFSEIQQLFKLKACMQKTICVLLEDKPPSDIIRKSFFIFDKNQLALTSLGGLAPLNNTKELDHLLLNKCVANRKLAIKSGEIFVSIYTALTLFIHFYENSKILNLNNNEENITELINFSPIFTNNTYKRKLYFISD
jgi:hypothetical protein